MQTFRVNFAVLILAAVAVPTYAQQATDAPKTTPATAAAPATQTAPASQTAPAADSTASDNAEAAATAALIAKANANAAAAAKAKPAPLDAATFAKRVKQNGWRQEVRKGANVYCRDAQEVGSRFTTHRCLSEPQLAELLERQEFDRDQLRQHSCGGNCGGN